MSVETFQFKYFRSGQTHGSDLRVQFQKVDRPPDRFESNQPELRRERGLKLAPLISLSAALFRAEKNNSGSDSSGDCTIS